MKYCKKCIMPDTRPGSVFDEQGICQACKNYEKRKFINWEERKNELKIICDKYRRDDGYYDCIIPVSGGKDSHLLVYMMKEKMGMNPLLVTVGDPFTKTKAGEKNFKNLGETFNCDHILFNISTDLFRRVTKIAFEELGEPLKFVEAAIYLVPFKIAVKLNIQLVVFGENSAYEYGTTDKENYYANDYIYNIFKSINIDFWLQRGISKKEMNSIILPAQEEINKTRPEVIFMSYFYPWSSMTNLRIAKRYGFKDLTHEWKREGCIEDFEQIDSLAYLVHLWLKYPKFGFQRTSDIASRRIREGLLSLEKAKGLIIQNDHKLDQKALDDFISFLGYTTKQFWGITEKFWNTNIFKKINDIWQMRRECVDEFKRS